MSGNIVTTKNTPDHREYDADAEAKKIVKVDHKGDYSTEGAKMIDLLEELVTQQTKTNEYLAEMLGDRI